MYQRVVQTYPNRVGTVLTPQERVQLAVADLGLSVFETVGLIFHAYVNIGRVRAKKLAPPRQTYPQRLHLPAGGAGGRGRVRWGTLCVSNSARRLPVLEA